MEPGRGDRDDGHRTRRPGLPLHAAMEPGRGDRDDVAPRQSTPAPRSVPQWSPVAVTGMTDTTEVARDLAWVLAAMGPGRGDRDDGRRR